MILIASPHPGSYAMFVALNACGILFLLAGLTLRERATVQAFLVKRSLDEVNKALATLNAELEGRVEAQVAEIRKRAHDVEVLNTQLQQRVIERSRELAVALGRLARPARLKSPPVGTVLNGRIELVRTIDSGGMGDVFEGLDRATQMRVAVKTIHGRRMSDVSSLHRFLTEARAAAAVAHEGIVRTLDVDVTEDGTLFHVMELLEGETLADWIVRAPHRTVGAVARVGRVIAEALAAAHAAGVVHRDVKPANVMLIKAPPGAKLLDFGVSKLDEALPDDARKTVATMFLGTPAYMAPEQARDPSTASFAADVFSLGVVLYEALTGTLPYPPTTTSDVPALSGDPPRDLAAASPGLPPLLVGAVMQCLERDPRQRPSAAMLAASLAAFEDVVTELAPGPLGVDVHASTAASDDASHRRTKQGA